MKSIVVHSSVSDSASPTAWIMKHGGSLESDGRAVLSNGEHWIASEDYVDIELELDALEQEQLRAAVGDSVSYLVTWRNGSEHLLGLMLAELSETGLAFIDNDADPVRPLSEFRHLPPEIIIESALPAGRASK